MVERSACWIAACLSSVSLPLAFLISAMCSTALRCIDAETTACPAAAGLLSATCCTITSRLAAAAAGFGASAGTLVFPWSLMSSSFGRNPSHPPG